MQHYRKSGFTLIELSIVLVMIGLIVGGILVGRDLIRVAELRSVVTDIERFKTAAKTFELKYNCLPGDCLNATDYFGTASNCPGGPGTGTQTCNGNGDGMINYGSTANPPDPSILASQELFLFWQHLSNAGLIAGQYKGFAAGANSWEATVGVTVPASKEFGNGGYGAGNLQFATAPSYNFSGVDYTNVMWIGSKYDSTGTSIVGPTYGPLLTTSDAMNIDGKVDDGLPGTGNVFTWAGAGNVWYEPDCATSSNPATAKYNITNIASACSLMWGNAF